MKIKSILYAGMSAIFAISFSGNAQEPQAFDYSKLKLVDEIVMATDNGAHEMRQFPDDNASALEDILGQKCRVLKMGDSSRYMVFKIGAGKGLKAGSAYVLAIDYPEDKSRSMFIQNRGCETGSGFATGQEVGDCVVGKYVNNNPESLKYPLSNAYRRWSQFFYLHQRFPNFGTERHGDTARSMTPDQGFWVFIAQVDMNNAPLSAGAAVAKIALYEVEDPEAYNVKINYPPEGLPRRHIFGREEMADGVVSVPHGQDKPLARGMDNPNDWFEMKMKNLRFLGMNTFSKDLLEFGHNQGWDAGDDSWVAASTPQRWREMVETLSAKYKDLYVLPYYEYGGATGKGEVGYRKSVKPLANKKGMFSHIEWIEKNAHIDITDPDALADAKKMLDKTIICYKDKVKFVGAWLRNRPSQMPVSFSDMALAKYADETKIKVTREEFSADKAKLDAYYKWWFEKRHAFIAELAKHLRANGVGEDAIVLLTTDTSEPGRSLPGNVIVTDDVELWKTAMAKYKKKCTPVSYEQVVKDNLYGKEILTPIGGTWGEWEWQHSTPGADPANFKAKDGTMVSYSFNRLYTVAVPEALDSYRSGDGLAIIRHYTLNENMMTDKNDKEIMGYFCSDLDRAGPYCMLAEARAVANGDPRYIGYLNGNTMARGFPQYVRAFNAAFLALPALPSKVVENAASDPEVVVREIPAGKDGSYLAVVNTGFNPKKDVVINIPKCTKLVDSVTGAELKMADGKLTVSMYPGELRAMCGK
ncbi:MAG TPA: hypothetical protein DET40_24240 [Lentisphaeria bacterium]|nr:MAG: hypothetical protein A2X45_21185 [Lentisphaerae bacterium GWF2_50_93]HCE46670.1 hypothetical protein [Lentisphaeria bacterium]